MGKREEQNKADAAERESEERMGHQQQAVSLANVVSSTVRHRSFVRLALLRIRQELELRGEEHDLSKFDPGGELPGFARINATARQHPYGSEEHTAAIRTEAGTVDQHYAANSHHPEFHKSPSSMGFLDIIEMVCDWHGASRGYGTTKWEDVLAKQRERFEFTESQWWLIDRVAEFLATGPHRTLVDDPLTADEPEGCPFGNSAEPDEKGE